MRILVTFLVILATFSPLAAAGGLSLGASSADLWGAVPQIVAESFGEFTAADPVFDETDVIVAPRARDVDIVVDQAAAEIESDPMPVVERGSSEPTTEPERAPDGVRDESPPPASRVVRVASPFSLAGAVTDIAASLVNDAETVIRGAARAADDALGGAGPGASGSGPAARAQAAAASVAGAARSEAVAGAVLALVGVSAIAFAGASPQNWSVIASRLRRFSILALAPLYTRLSPGDALESDARGRIFKLIQARPGITLAGLAAATDLSRTAVSHHVRILERDALIATRREGRVRLFFENGRARVIDARAVAVLDHVTTRAVARAVAESPGMDQSAVCRAFALRPSLAHWHLAKLESVDLIAKSRDGRRVRYAPGASYAGARSLGIV